MRKDVKTKILIVFLFSTLILMLVAKTNAPVTSETFTSYFPEDSSLGFQHENRFVILTVTSGTLNSSECTLQFDSEGGTYRFKANETVTLQIDYNVSNVYVNENFITSGETAEISQDDLVTIRWNILLQPLLPVLFIFGMIGFGGMFGGPLYAVNKLKKGEYRDALRTGFLVTIIGICFVLAWLW